MSSDARDDVEIIARGLARARIERNHDPLIKGRDAAWLQRAEDAGWQYFVDDAKVALAALNAAGRFVLPKEPDEAMLTAGWTQTGESKAMRPRVFAQLRRMYEAMTRR